MKSVTIFDMEGRIERFIKGAEETLGYSAEEVVGKERVSVLLLLKRWSKSSPQWRPG